jgi:4-amino-4-deoxychorismate lyase
MILVNGEYKDHVDISDRGFQYGDGLFETIEVRSGKPVFLDLHLARLTAGCRRLQFPSPSLAIIRRETAELCQHSQHAVLKLIITRGPGGRGYRQPDVLQPTRVLSLHPYPDYPDAYRELGINVRFCQTRLGLNPALAGMKHLNRLEQVLARAEWNDPAIQEGIMLDINDHVIEGTMTNLFFIRNKTVYTPALTLSGVDGIIRRVIMNFLTRQQFALTEKVLSKDDLLAADEAFVCNSIIGIWPIKQIENTRYQIGPVTRQCQIRLNDTINEALNDEQ